MLEELLKEKRGRDDIRTVKLILWALAAVVVAVLLAIYLPPVIAYFRRLNETIGQIQQTLDQIRAATDNVRDTVVSLGESGRSALQSAVGALNELLERIPRIFR